jgi:methylated-DNA-protein-cysteine methyltransferase-like protein
MYARIYQWVAQIPKGRVSSYGRISKLAGGCSARQVGYAMSALPEGSDVPWQRVVNSKGGISPRSGGDSHRLQRWLLEDEGLEFGADGTIDMGRFGWPEEMPMPGTLKGLFDA